VAERIKYCKIGPKKIHLQASMGWVRSGAGLSGPPWQAMSYHRREIKVTLPGIAARHGAKAEVRLYARLFVKVAREGDRAVDFKAELNPDSLTVPSPAYASSFPLPGCRPAGSAT